MNEMELYFWFQNLFIKISLIISGIYIFCVLIIPLYYLIKEEITNKIRDYKEKNINKEE